MDTIFMNFENCKTSDPHRLLFNLLYKKKSQKGLMTMLLYQKWAFTIHGKI